MIIEKVTLSNGAHRNQSYSGSSIPNGWVELPIEYAPFLPFISVTENEDGTYSFADNPEARVAASMPALSDIQTAKLTEINAACDKAIASGCDVTLSDGTAGHISLTLPDQINLTNAQGAIQAGKTGYAYHLDGNLCEVYGAADIAIMATAATTHVLYQQTYCNHIRAWVKRCTTVADVQSITYGAVLPDDLAAHMAAVIAAAGGGNDATA